MSDEVTLTEDLFDTRDPKRSPVFVAGKGQTVPRRVAEALGVKLEVATKARRGDMVEDKAVKPAATKAPVRTKKS